MLQLAQLTALQRPALTGPLQELRHLPDRLLHPLRRSLARRRLRAEGAPSRVLFICEGNIYRSPFAAAALRERLTPVARARITIESCGFLRAGRPCPTDALAGAERRGISLADHRSTRVTWKAVEAADLVVVMEPRQVGALRERYGMGIPGLMVLGDLDPAAIRTRAITDPWTGDEGVLEASYSRIERCLDPIAACIEG